MIFLQNKLIKLIIIFLLLLPVCLAAGTTGKIVGLVVDESTGEPLAGVNVIIENTVLGAATDLDGGYFIIGIPPGKYTIIANYISYACLLYTSPSPRDRS